MQLFVTKHEGLFLFWMRDLSIKFGFGPLLPAKPLCCRTVRPNMVWSHEYLNETGWGEFVDTYTTRLTYMGFNGGGGNFAEILEWNFLNSPARSKCSEQRKQPLPPYPDSSADVCTFAACRIAVFIIDHCNAVVVDRHAVKDSNRQSNCTAETCKQ